MMSEEGPLSVLKEYWGYDSFRPMQKDIIDAALRGEDVLAILPTGGGKSVCFQVPALLKEGTALVVTPLIALMKDQVQNLRDRGIKALAVYAGMTQREVENALNNAAYGDFKFLYLSPERLSTPLFREYLKDMNISFIVVDEAHCISQWGYDFRPEYLKINALRQVVDAPVIALTATATPQVAEDIAIRLGFTEMRIMKSGFERPNLSYVVRRTEDKKGQLLSICNSVKGSGIVYVRSRSRAEEIAAFLRSEGISASFYHAGLGPEARATRQEMWKSGNIRVMACTNAFGMGIDKPDVRFVVHTDIPESPESYFQEAGRAGRDGKESYTVLLWNDSDLRRMKQIEAVSFPGLDYIEDIYHKVHIFFGIPYDAGEGSQLKFHLEEFCKQFSLNRRTAYYAIKYIEKAGHWSLMEDFQVRTRVQVRVTRQELYDIVFPEKEMKPVLETLMRNYSGLFSFPVAMDEEFVSSRSGISVPHLRQILYKLSLDHIINYIPCDTSDIIFLLHPRLHPKDVDLQPQLYEMLRGMFHDRMQMMIDYVSEEDVCRSRFLLEYFGQTESADCGKCDVCRGRKSGSVASNGKRTGSDKVENDVSQLLDDIINLRLKGRYSMQDLVTGPWHLMLPPGWTEVLSRLVDEGKIPSSQENSQ